MSRPVPSRRRRWVRRVLALVLAVLVATAAGFVALGWKVVHRPHLDPVPDEPVDALVVLGPLDPWRITAAERLMREHRAHNLVLSTPNMPWDARYCKHHHDWPAFCFPPDPSTTRGEAMGYRELARQHGWHSLAVLTIDFHADRSRFIFERCLRTDVVVLGEHQHDFDRQMPFQVAYQAAGYAKELVLGRCPG